MEHAHLQHILYYCLQPTLLEKLMFATGCLTKQKLDCSASSTVQYRKESKNWSSLQAVPPQLPSRCSLWPSRPWSQSVPISHLSCSLCFLQVTQTHNVTLRQGYLIRITVTLRVYNMLLPHKQCGLQMDTSAWVRGNKNLSLLRSEGTEGQLNVLIDVSKKKFRLLHHLL